MNAGLKGFEGGHMFHVEQCQQADDFMQDACQLILNLRWPPLGGYVFC